MIDSEEAPRSDTPEPTEEPVTARTTADRPAPEGAAPADAPAEPEGKAAPPSSEKVSQRPPAPESAPQPASSQRPVDPTAEAKAEAARLRDQLLRTAADFDNFRKRTRRELEDAARRGKESALKELLPVFDNLERAAAHAEGAPDLKSVSDGLRMVMKQFESTLDKLGVKRIQAVGAPFDPAVHEAIQHLESAEHPAGTVLNEVLGGYTIGDHLLRAAMVVVSKGPPAGDGAPS
jgi:molecular chaperone GrpE